jgi:hypothetical protein
MFALLVNPSNHLPIIVNVNSDAYFDMTFQGYQPIATGYRKQLETIEEEMLSEMYGELELNNSN